MCRPANCKTCGKAAYAGCGQHVEGIMRGVPSKDRCKCESGKPARRKMFGKPTPTK